MDLKQLEHSLRTYRPAGINGLPPEFVWPRYDGASVGNIAATVAQSLGATLHAGTLPPLQADLLGDLADGVQRVVVLVMDALGWGQLQQTMLKYPELVFHRLAKEGRLQPITTTFLSTTTSVLSTIWSGYSPAQHGQLAFEMYMREWLMAVESISFSPVHAPFSRGLLDWGFDPEKFQPIPTLGMQLAVQGVLSYTVISKAFTDSPLSRMNFKGMREVRGHVTASDFWLKLRDVLKEHRGQRFMLAGYWSPVDTLSHKEGPLSEIVEAEIASIGLLMEKLFLDKLEPEDREGTLLLMTADHGQIMCPAESAVIWDEHPVLQAGLSMRPVGESRVPFFHVRRGYYERVWDYLQENFAEQFYFLPGEEVLDSGLLGPGRPYVETLPRLGDIVGISKGTSFFERDREKLGLLRGRHGGLSPEEMLVPLLAVRLG